MLDDPACSLLLILPNLVDIIKISYECSKKKISVIPNKIKKISSKKNIGKSSKFVSNLLKYDFDFDPY